MSIHPHFISNTYQKVCDSKPKNKEQTFSKQELEVAKWLIPKKSAIGLANKSDTKSQRSGNESGEINTTIISSENGK